MKKILTILGPTATGKTDLAVKFAKIFDAELISADSRQVYSGLDVGSGKYSPGDRFKKFSGKWLLNDVAIHGYDLVAPEKRFTAADFAKFFARTAEKIWKKKILAILVGGSGFYLEAALKGFETLGIAPNYQLRKQLEKLTAAGLFERLLKLDKRKAGSLSPSDRLNPRRLIRAIEVADFLKTHPNFIPMYPYIRTTGTNVLKIGLNCRREELYKRIDGRVNERLKIGMTEEVENLLRNKVNPNWLESLGLEYYWVTFHLLGKIDYDEMVEKLKGDIHDAARRQLTWFKKDADIVWFDIAEKNFFKKVEKEVKKWYTQ